MLTPPARVWASVEAVGMLAADPKSDLFAWKGAETHEAVGRISTSPDRSAVCAFAPLVRLPKQHRS